MEPKRQSHTMAARVDVGGHDREHTTPPAADPQAVRQHAYEILQRDAKLSSAECQFYEEEVRRWIDEKRTFTAYDVSYAINGVLRRSGKVGLRHAVTRDAVKAFLSLYLDNAGYKSSIEDLGDDRRPRLYYPDEAVRLSWLAAQMPTASLLKELAAPAPAGKHGRKRNEEVAMWANLRRWQGWTWPRIAKEGETLHPDLQLSWRAIYMLWSRAYGKKAGEQAAKECQPEKRPSKRPQPDWELCHAQCTNPNCHRPGRWTPIRDAKTGYCRTCWDAKCRPK